ncbi:MAG: hypothetical protein COB98_02585 [Flavobacteriaceae bacterium]|nr:MAG: hypothetical protein COB98_02585 [Flavobacteriaceae bacterium]
MLKTSFLRLYFIFGILVITSFSLSLWLSKQLNKEINISKLTIQTLEEHYFSMKVLDSNNRYPTNNQQINKGFSYDASIQKTTVRLESQITALQLSNNTSIPKLLEILKTNTKEILRKNTSEHLEKTPSSSDFNRYTNSHNSLLKAVEKYRINRENKVLALGIISPLVLLLLFMGSYWKLFRPTLLDAQERVAHLKSKNEVSVEKINSLKRSNKNQDVSLSNYKDLQDAFINNSYIVRLDTLGIITLGNSNFSKLTGYPVEAFFGKRIADLASAIHPPSFFKHMWETMRDGELWHGELQLQTKEGQLIWMNLRLTPVLNTTDKTLSYIGTFINISQRFEEEIDSQRSESQAIIHGQENERKRIAFDLHDGLGQHLTGLKLTIEALKLENTTKQQQLLSNIKKGLKDTINETRRISHNLMPASIEEFGLQAAIRQMVSELNEQTETTIVFEEKSNIERMNPRIEIAIYRGVQESLSNAIKYSQASMINVIIDATNAYYHIHINDNGIGFDPSATEESTKSYGLHTMKERAKMFHGTFYIRSQPSEGTYIHMTVPKQG